MLKVTIALGIAPIGWTNDDMPDLGKEVTFEQAIDEMALAGYQGTEVGNKYPKDPVVLKHYLDLRHLKIASAWFSAFLTTKPYEETEAAFIKHRDFLHAMGAKVIVFKACWISRSLMINRILPMKSGNAWPLVWNGWGIAPMKSGCRLFTIIIWAPEFKQRQKLIN